METAFICMDELWARGFGELHPLKPERLKRTYELLTAYRAFDAPNSHLAASVPVSREELPLFHTAEYVDTVARLSSGLGPQSLGPRTRGLLKGGGGERASAWRYGFRPDETPVLKAQTQDVWRWE